MNLIYKIENLYFLLPIIKIIPFCIFHLYLIFCHNRQQAKSCCELLLFFFFPLTPESSFKKQARKVNTTYLITYLTCNKVVLIVASSKLDIFEPVSYIWLTGIYAELHIAKLIQDLKRKIWKSKSFCSWLSILIKR